jgi:hypothetical protein
MYRNLCIIRVDEINIFYSILFYSILFYSILFYKFENADGNKKGIN